MFGLVFIIYDTGTFWHTVIFDLFMKNYTAL